MNVPYSLRHAAVSTWLRTTGDAALVARWAGHSVNVLLTVYARAIDGAQSETLDRIWQATRRRGQRRCPRLLAEPKRRTGSPSATRRGLENGLSRARIGPDQP